jgi:D-alanine-D-alanine ligase
LGSSIGIAVAKDEEELKAALDTAFALDDCAVVEKYLAEKQDVNCAAYSLNGEIYISEPELAFRDGIYSFEEKYVKRKEDGNAGVSGGKGGNRVALSGELREKIRAYTRTVYKRMNMRGVVRLDFLVSGGKAYLCEVNTVPGSLAYYLFCERVSDAKNFFSDLIEDAITRDREEKAVLQTGILRTVRWQGK